MIVIVESCPVHSMGWCSVFVDKLSGLAWLDETEVWSTTVGVVFAGRPGDRDELLRGTSDERQQVVSDLVLLLLENHSSGMPVI